MDIEDQSTYEQEMLNQARRQTAALESLRGMVFAWIALVVVALISWGFFALALTR